mmetsp:Transcript_9609/g.18046  ORF Transcript_9609/g.18046 Transcript_9609/m.18046 type:complete len:200 (-) Transcript_9609:138-737(-)
MKTSTKIFHFQDQLLNNRPQLFILQSLHLLLILLALPTLLSNGRISKLPLLHIHTHLFPLLFKYLLCSIPQFNTLRTPPLASFETIDCILDYTIGNLLPSILLRIPCEYRPGNQENENDHDCIGLGFVRIYHRTIFEKVFVRSFTEEIIFLAEFVGGEHRVGLVDFHEAIIGTSIFVFIRMPPFTQRSITLCDILFIRG